jgi:hypothetical protein
MVVNGLVDVLMKGGSRGSEMYMYMEQHNEGE